MTTIAALLEGEEEAEEQRSFISYILESTSRNIFSSNKRAMKMCSKFQPVRPHLIVTTIPVRRLKIVSLHRPSTPFMSLQSAHCNTYFCKNQNRSMYSTVVTAVLRLCTNSVQSESTCKRACGNPFPNIYRKMCSQLNQLQYYVLQCTVQKFLTIFNAVRAHTELCKQRWNVYCSQDQSAVQNTNTGNKGFSSRTWTFTSMRQRSYGWPHHSFSEDVVTASLSYGSITESNHELRPYISASTVVSSQCILDYSIRWIWHTLQKQNLGCHRTRTTPHLRAQKRRFWAPLTYCACKRAKWKQCGSIETISMGHSNLQIHSSTLTGHAFQMSIV